MDPRLRPELLGRVARRLAPFALRGALVTGSCLVGLFVGEAAVRLVVPQQLIMLRPDLWQAADSVGYLRRPRIDTRINTGEREARVITDDAGFRIGAAGERTEGAEVLLLGDSFMEALQVDYEQSAAGLMEVSIAESIGEPVALRNAGISGWDPDQYFLRARTLLDRERYDLVITALYLGNDVIPVRRDYVPPREPVQRARLRLPRGLSFGEITESLLRPINDFLEVRSHLFMLFKNRLGTLRMALGLAPTDFPPQFFKSESASARWEITADLCAEIDALARRQGIPALFVLIPTAFQVDSTEFHRQLQGYGIDAAEVDLDQPNRLLGELLADRELRVVDILADLQAAHDGGTQLYGSVDQHFTPAGNALFAELITPVAAALLDRADSSPDDGTGSR